MIRISLPYMWQISESFNELSDLNPAQEIELYGLMLRLFNAQNELEGLLQGSVFSSTLRSSRPLAERLLSLIREQMNKDDTSGEVPKHVVWRIKTAYDQFRIAFLAELGTFPSYFVSQKGSHDTLTLLDQPWLMFPADLPEKVPEAMFDVAEAGKALCYELPTACGFHLFRATEAVLRRYYSHETGGHPHPKARNIMVYVQSMRKLKCGDEKVLSVIEQMSKLHRNPIIHPEAVLNLDEAITILGVARSAVTAMLRELPTLPATTASHGLAAAAPITVPSP